MKERGFEITGRRKDLLAVIVIPPVFPARKLKLPQPDKLADDVAVLAGRAVAVDALVATIDLAPGGAASEITGVGARCDGRGVGVGVDEVAICRHRKGDGQSREQDGKELHIEGILERLGKQLKCESWCVEVERRLGFGGCLTMVKMVVEAWMEENEMTL